MPLEDFPRKILVAHAQEDGVVERPDPRVFRLQIARRVGSHREFELVTVLFIRC
jgi:hypothetical protein